MSNPVLVNTALRVLRQSGIWKIAFDLHGLTVTGQRYAMVARAIADGKIACEAVDTMPVNAAQKLAPGTKVGALYNPDQNTIYFPREDYGKINIYEQTVIVHEATHAIFDLFAATSNDQVLAIEDESAAVLAQALFLRLCTNNDSVAIHRFSMMIDGPGDLALKLADRMMTETGDFEKDKRTYFLRSEQTAKLRAAVAQEWNLIKDGDSDRSGIVSIYNGVVACYSCWVHGT
jgi:hypothetical protein